MHVSILPFLTEREIVEYNLFLLMPKHGGHCGFIYDIYSLSWADRVVIDYLEAILEFTMKVHTINIIHIS
jgi:predicted alpha/beta-fold hydrolase